MDAQNLDTASTYINNLLLARGLLRHGKSIDFAAPSKGAEGADGTMARVINLIHDMVLRRDREAEQRESMALTLRSLRATETKQNLDIERLQSKNADLERQISIKTATERGFQASVRTAECTARSLREETARLKTMLAQVRNHCAMDVRKRDLQIQKLKTHLTAQQRGSRPANSSSTIVITPGVSVPAAKASAVDDSYGLGTSDSGLRQETTEFLTQLCQSLTDENANLLSLSRTTLSTLRSLQGLPESHNDRNFAPSATVYEDLASATDDVLTQLRSLLTNPAFVPIDELEAREEEIIRLRKGWEKMETRWQEAVAMMEHWRRKIERSHGGRGVDLEELKKGLGLGIAISPFKGVDETQTKSHEVSDEEIEIDPTDDDTDMSDDASLVSEGSPNLSAISDDSIPSVPVGSVLAEVPYNKIRSDPKAARYQTKEEFTTIQEENTRDLRNLEKSSSEKPQVISANNKSESSGRLKSKIPHKPSLSSGRISTKLERASTEAAQAREKLSKRVETVTRGTGEGNGVTKKSSAKATRRRSGLSSAIGAGKGRKSRRRSTLTSEELESLIAGGLG